MPSYSKAHPGVSERDLFRVAKAVLRDEITEYGKTKPVAILRRDGNTDLVYWTGRKDDRIRVVREPGHRTGGMWIDPDDIPGIVWLD